MPHIQKPTPKQKTTFHNDTKQRQLRQKAYNDSRWKNVRNAHLVAHPLCEDCLKEGKVNGTDIQVHHIQSAFAKGEILYDKLLDDKNLITVCSYHHAIRHQEEKGYKKPELIINELDKLLNE